MFAFFLFIRACYNISILIFIYIINANIYNTSDF